MLSLELNWTLGWLIVSLARYLRLISNFPVSLPQVSSRCWLCGSSSRVFPFWWNSRNLWYLFLIEQSFSVGVVVELTVSIGWVRARRRKSFLLLQTLFLEHVGHLTQIIKLVRWVEWRIIWLASLWLLATMWVPAWSNGLLLVSLLWLEFTLSRGRG